MWIGKPGKVCDELDFIGESQNCVYLLRGDVYMIIGGAMSWIAPSLERQFAAMDFDPDKLKYLVITHSHFDHCGVVPYLKRKFPALQIVASVYAREVLSKAKVIDSIADFNQRLIDLLELQNESERLNLEFDGIDVDHVVSEGDIIDLGNGIEAHFLETPGHTRCSISLYIPKLKAMFPSDATPFPASDGGGLSFPSPQYDFGLYMESLKKVVSYDVDICAYEHYGVFIGEQAKEVLLRGLKRAEWFKNCVTRKYQEIGDLDELAKLLADEMDRISGFNFLSRDVRVTVAKAVLSKVLA